MRRTTIAIAAALAGTTAALGGHLIVNAAASTGADTELTRSFVTPRLDGRRLDVRFSATNPAAPEMTAARFCRSQGFDEAQGFSTQTVTKTRLIGDYSTAEGSLSAFYAIRCSGQTSSPA